VIRNLIILALVLFGGFFLVLTIAYDTTEPCRALAVEEARRSAAPTGVAHVWARIKLGHENRLTCSRALIRSWQDRLSS
jgi:hypothetical protein